MDKISVCIASYNGERFIERQIHSILIQLGKDDEVIISDDGSTDETISIINSFNDRRIFVTFNRGINGPVGNFEQALNQVTGDYVFLADQDDVWLPEKVSSVVSLLRKYDLVLSDCVVVNEKDEVVQPSFFRFRGSQPGFWHNTCKNSYMGCCMAFRREVLSYALPFPPRIHMHDWWIGLLVEVKGKVYFHSQPMINYVRHGNNASPTGESGYGIVKRLKNRYYLLINVFKRLKA